MLDTDSTGLAWGSAGLVKDAVSGRAHQQGHSAGTNSRSGTHALARTLALLCMQVARHCNTAWTHAHSFDRAVARKLGSDELWNLLIRRPIRCRLFESLTVADHGCAAMYNVVNVEGRGIIKSTLLRKMVN